MGTTMGKRRGRGSGRRVAIGEVVSLSVSVFNSILAFYFSEENLRFLSPKRKMLHFDKFDIKSRGFMLVTRGTNLWQYLFPDEALQSHGHLQHHRLLVIAVDDGICVGRPSVSPRS